MTDSTTSPEKQHPRPRRRRGLLFILAIVLAAGLTGAFVGQAVSHGFGAGWRHGAGFMGGAADSAHIEEHADRVVRHLAIEIDATPDQQTALRAIVTAAAKDLLPLRDRAQAAHQQAHGLLTAPSVDRASLEVFRAEHLALLDQGSKRLAQAIGDAAEVLTPEQRQKLSDLLARHRGHRHGWHRG